MAKEIINTRQFSWLVALYIIGSSILIIPAGLAAVAKQDAWISAIVSIGVGTLLVVFYGYFMKKFPDMTIVEASEKVLGKWIGQIASLMFFSFLFLLAALVLRNIGDFLTTQILIETPLYIIFTIFMIIVIMGASLGIETIARACEIFFPWVFCLLILLTILLMPEMQFEAIKPIMENGVKPIIRASIPFIGLPFLELVAFLMIYRHVDKHNKLSISFLKGTAMGSVVLFVIICATILVLGADFTARYTYPTYILAKKISIGKIVERIEVIVAIVWMLSIYFKLVLLFYTSARTLTQIFRVQNYRLLLFPLGIGSLVLAQISYPDIIYMQDFVSKTWTLYASIYGIGFPMLLILVAKSRKLI
ncbi:endospore germination permease [Anaerobacillus sp. 1_MG-2023]|uniref:GerAB/ArcD/ProY family transporter n=1 Tax=Anaerobacillus sp. 1_MG-2023 TaxID=3062655 RepID=UPI0026E441BC|nr:endospore germination permease [Anaerobacillus sp. 1_MG-2023]MDO6654272.1 endospore germination permease [Anaerobacillus sp. 1_MG-2023]